MEEQILSPKVQKELEKILKVEESNNQWIESLLNRKQIVKPKTKLYCRFCQNWLFYREEIEMVHHNCTSKAHSWIKHADIDPQFKTTK